MRSSILILVFASLVLAGCSLGSPAGSSGGSSANGSPWIRTPIASGNVSGGTFQKTAADGSGNILAVGKVNGYVAWSSDVVSDLTSADTGYLLTKFSPTGKPLWSRMLEVPAGALTIGGLATGSGNSIYLVGSYDDEGHDSQVALGTTTDSEVASIAGRSTAGSTLSGDRAFVVKYNSSGVVEWNLQPEADETTWFRGVIFQNDRAIAVGGVGSGSVLFQGRTIDGPGATNLLAAAVTSAGSVEWARTSINGPLRSELTAVAHSGTKIVALGYLEGPQDGLTVPGNDGALLLWMPPNDNVSSDQDRTAGLVLDLTDQGTASAGRLITYTDGSGVLSLNSVAVDSAGRVYVAGRQSGQHTITAGDGVNLEFPEGGYEPFLIQYASDGTAHWGRVLASDRGYPDFLKIAVDPADRLVLLADLSAQASYRWDGQDSFWFLGTADFPVNPLVRILPDGTWSRVIAVNTVTSLELGLQVKDFVFSPQGQLYAVGGGNSGTWSWDGTSSFSTTEHVGGPFLLHWAP